MSAHVSRRRSSTRIVVALGLLTAITALVGPQLPARAVISDVVISQVYGGGGNSGATLRNDFIEIFNRGTAPVNLTGWSVQYAASTGVNWQRTNLTGVTLQPGQYYLVAQARGTGGTVELPTPDAAGTITMSATAGKIALMSTSSTIVSGTVCPSGPTTIDVVGYGSGTNCSETAPAPGLSNTTAALRNGGGCTETDDNASDFTAAAPTPRNTSSPLAPCGTTNQPVVASCGAALNAVAGFGGARAVSASDADGRVIDIQISNVTPVPASGGLTVDALVPAASIGATATATVTVDPATSLGTYTVNVTATNDDPTPQTGTCALTVTVLPITPIGVVQSPVGDADNGLTHRSPFAPASGNGTGQTVAVQGVVYERTLARTSAGAAQHGFFVQNTAATADGDPTSSDGIFVFMGGFTSLIGGYVPVVGDEVVITGRVSEFFNLTQLSSASLLQVVQSGVDLDAELPAFEVDPPDVLADANRHWERHEGARVLVPSGSIAIDGRDVFPSTADAEVWLARGDSEIAQRADPFARRAFRDPHPLDDDPALFDNGNGYRIVLGSLGVKAIAGDNTELLTPVRTFDTLTNELVGGVYFSFSKYQIQVTQQPVVAAGVDPSTNAPPQPFERDSEYSLATFNVENLYDFRDDPFDGCDFAGNTGCLGVSPPFDYVPASDAAYQARLGEIAAQISGDLHAPDVIMVQEAEDQDICTVTGAALVCGTTDDADGRPDTLQELAVRIAELGGPAYDAAYDRDGADDRGIVAALMYRTDRVELLPAPADDPVLASAPAVDYRGTPLPYVTDVQNPKALNAVLPADVDVSTGQDGPNVFTRDPQVGLFRVWRDGVGSGTAVDVYVISNHFSSTPDARVGQRQEQAAYNAAIVDALQDADSDVKVAVGGDLNVYPRPDDPFTPDHPRYPSDQLGALYDQGLVNMFDAVLADEPVAAYGYVFQGQTQTLDQTFVTPSLTNDLVQARIAHINADWPADDPGDGPRGTSDHDPSVVRFCRDVTPPTITAVATPDRLWPPFHQLVPVTVAVSATDDADDTVTVQLVSVVSDEPDDGLGDGDTTGDIVIVDDEHFQLRAERAATGDGRTYTITYEATDACGNTGTASVTVVVPRDQRG